MNVFLILVLFSIGCYGWGEVGHKAIAELAKDRLSQNSKNAVSHYLGGMGMYEVAPQPDDYVHGDGSFTEDWHFYNMNKGDTYFHMSECPNPPSCVVYGIQNFTNALTNAGSNGPFCSSENNPTVIFPCPLIFLIHLVGDIHQPLHCGYGYDAGGNEVKVDFFGKSTNLHSVWDSGMIYHYLDPSNGDWFSLYQYLSSDLSSNPNRESQYASITNPVTWANESISLVVNDVYNFGGSQVPDLGSAYYTQNWPIASQRMEAAGVRLATLLNNVFQNSSRHPHFDRALEFFKKRSHIEGKVRPTLKKK